MSKSLNPYLLPGLGVMGIALGVGVGMANRDYGASKIASLESRVAQVEAEATGLREGAAADAKVMEERIAAIQAKARAGGASAEPAPVAETGYGIGRPALAEEIAAWDVDVLPDGRGLPEGQGDVLWGEEVFAEKCASCHGDFAEGVDNWPVLAGGFDTLADEDPVKTVGSYWPYLSTVWDYVHRSMPFGGAQTLTDDEVYGIVAYILYSNDIVDEDFVLSHENFTDVEMHNTGGFVVDDRGSVEYAMWSGEPCMENCKDGVEITMRASFLDVTPEDQFTAPAGDSTMAAAAPAAETAAVTATETAAAPAAADGPDPELVAAGEKVFKKCKACHAIGEGAKNKSGPLLTGVMGRTMGEVDGFKYSGTFKTAAEEGRVWDAEAMAAFLAAPKAYMKGTKMAFAGLKKEAEIEAIIAYLQASGE